MTSDFCVRTAREVYRRPFRVGRRSMTEKPVEREFIRAGEPSPLSRTRAALVTGSSSSRVVIYLDRAPGESSNNRGSGSIRRASPLIFYFPLIPRRSAGYPENFCLRRSFASTAVSRSFFFSEAFLVQVWQIRDTIGRAA